MTERRELSSEEIDALVKVVNNKDLPAQQRWEARGKLCEVGAIKNDEPPPPVRLRPRADELPRRTGDGTRPASAIYEPVVIRMSDVTTEPIEWLWDGRVPSGKISMIVGDPGLGKSQVSVSMAAIVSSGGPWPDRPDDRVEPGEVLIMNAEDNLADTIKPRLEWAGANTDNVLSMTTVRKPDGHLTPFSIERDVLSLDLQLSRMTRPRLVIIDPVTSFIGGSDGNKSGEVRNAIDPLKTLAERHKVALVMVNHFNKGLGAKALYRCMGSIAFTGAARVVWAVTEHPKKRGIQVMTFVKSNISPPAGGLAFSMNRTTGGRFTWLGEPVPWTANEVMAMLRDQDERGGGEGKRGPRRDQHVAELIRNRLKDGPAKLRDIIADAADELGAPRTAVHRAVRRLNGHVHQFRGEDGLKRLELRPELGLKPDEPEAPQ